MSADHFSFDTFYEVANEKQLGADIVIEHSLIKFSVPSVGRGLKTPNYDKISFDIGTVLSLHRKH